MMRKSRINWRDGEMGEKWKGKRERDEEER